MADNHWEQEAHNWLRWTRTPDFDSYWHYRSAFFDDIVPAPRGRTLEIGCGEGRVCRDLVARGHRVAGIDAAATLIREAANADHTAHYLRADAVALPFPDGAFDLAVAYNSLMDVEDMPGTISEASRVLRDDGRLAVCITHPINDAGKFVAIEPDAPFVIAGRYLGERRRFDEVFSRDGLRMHFSGWCYSLEEYVRALEHAGMAIERLREPPASDESLSRFGDRMTRWRRLPMFLMFRAVKLSRPSSD